MSDDLRSVPTGADLNDDVYSSIFDQITDAETLRYCRLVCKRWRNQIQWLLEHPRECVVHGEVVKHFGSMTYTYSVVAGGVRHGPYHGHSDLSRTSTNLYVHERGRYYFGEGHGHQVSCMSINTCRTILPVHNHVHCDTAFIVNLEFNYVCGAIDVGYSRIKKFLDNGDLICSVGYLPGSRTLDGWCFIFDQFWIAERYAAGQVFNSVKWYLRGSDTIEVLYYIDMTSVTYNGDYTTVRNMVTKCRALYLRIDYWPQGNIHEAVPRRVDVYTSHPRIVASVHIDRFYCDRNGDFIHDNDVDVERTVRWLALQPLPTLPQLPPPEDRMPPLPSTRVPPVLPKMLEVLRTIE